MDEYAAARASLVRLLRSEITDERTLEAIATVPRERFVPEPLRPNAYENRPLPIGQDQTISQPLMVALMIQAMQLRGDEHVLEVGTGSGYQAALLSRLANDVVTVERVPQFVESARRRLADLGYSNVRVEIAEGGLGRPEDGPYDAISVTAGAPQVPQQLVDQLAMNGRMVIPVGGRRVQQLVRATKSDRGLTAERLGECRFVPLIADDGGWPEHMDSHNGARAIG